MKKVFLIICCSLFVTLQAAVMQEGEFTKEKVELARLKKDLDAFYKEKENEYKKQKADLENINKDIQAKLAKIEEIKAQNQKILDEIDRKVTDKAVSLYDKMKPKVAANIFKEMVANGNINDVFDIIIKLKEKKVLELLKLLDTKTSSQLMGMIKNYKDKQQTGGNK